MANKVEKVLSEALELPADQRADVAATLLDSLDTCDDEGVDEAWAQEIGRRIQGIESGTVKTIPWAEARRRILSLRDASNDS